MMGNSIFINGYVLTLYRQITDAYAKRIITLS